MYVRFLFAKDVLSAMLEFLGLTPIFYFIIIIIIFYFKKLMPSNIQYPHSHSLMQSANLMSLTSAKRKCHLRDKMQQKGRRLCSHFTCQAAGRYHFYTVMILRQ